MERRRNRGRDRGPGPCGRQGGEDGTGAHQGRADRTEAPQGGADGPGAHQGGAEGTGTHQGRADRTEAPQGGAEGTGAHQGRADRTVTLLGGAEGTGTHQGRADRTEAPQGRADGPGSHRQMPSPEAVLWWYMWPKCNIVQSPPWEAFRTGVTVHGQEGQSEWISGDQLCVQTPAVCPSSWISTSELVGLTLNPLM